MAAVKAERADRTVSATAALSASPLTDSSRARQSTMRRSDSSA